MRGASRLFADLAFTVICAHAAYISLVMRHSTMYAMAEWRVAQRKDAVYRSTLYIQYIDRV